MALERSRLVNAMLRSFLVRFVPLRSLDTCIQVEGFEDWECHELTEDFPFLFNLNSFLRGINKKGVSAQEN